MDDKHLYGVNDAPFFADFNGDVRPGHISDAVYQVFLNSPSARYSHDESATIPKAGVDFEQNCRSHDAGWKRASV